MSSVNKMLGRSRNFSLITYHDEAIILQVLESVLNIRHYAFIFHDKDKKEESDELKEPHTHVLVNLSNPMTANALKKLFPSTCTTLAEIMRDKHNCFNYLTHEDEPSKYQYSADLIKSDDLSWWNKQKEGGEDNEKCMNILDDILGGVSFRELARRYGRDVVLNYDRYTKFAGQIRCEESAERGSHVVDCSNKGGDYIRLVDLETGEVVKKYKPKAKKGGKKV